MSNDPSTPPADEFRLVQLDNSFNSFGMVLDLLSQHPPFRNFELGTLAAALRMQLRYRHHFAAVRHDRIIGYTGWVPVTRDNGAAWLKGEADLHPVFDRVVDGVAVNIVFAPERAVTFQLIAAARNLNVGKHAFFKRAGRPAAGQRIAVFNLRSRQGRG